MDSPRVKTITIHDFKGFHLHDVPTIALDGKNLLLYGENGSGKTTIFTALKELLSLAPTREFDNDFSKVSCLKNRLSPVKSDDGKVSLEFKDAKGQLVNVPPMEWRINHTRPSEHSYFVPMSLSSGFLDYRAILLTHFLDFENDQINSFKLVVETVLRDFQMTQDLPGSFGSEWKDIQEQQSKLATILNTDPMRIDPAHPDYLTTISRLNFNVNDYPREELEDELDGDNALEIDVQAAYQRFVDDKHQKLADRITEFISYLQEQLGEVEKLANHYLKTFDPWLEIMFERNSITVPTDKAALADTSWKSHIHLPLRAKFRGNTIEHPGTVFNEARLTALALTIYLAALKVQANAQARVPNPQNAPRLLVLDDVLIGLDMVHRLPILQTLETEFVADNWQVILLTFDKIWYEVAKQRLTGKWQHYELFAVRVGNYEKPVLLPDADHLKRARDFYEAGEFKAAAVHLRTKFELVLKNACSEFRIPVQYHAEDAKVQTHELWDALISHCWSYKPTPKVTVDTKGQVCTWTPKAQERRMIEPGLIAQIKHSLSWVLNPLSHSENVNSYSSEISNAILAVGKLEHEIQYALNRSGKANPDDEDVLTELRRLLVVLLQRVIKQRGVRHT